MPFAAAADAAGHPATCLSGSPWVNMASCRCVATNAALSWRVSAVIAEMLSFVAWEMALFDKCIFVIWFWMLAWINAKLLSLLSVALKAP